MCLGEKREKLAKFRVWNKVPEEVLLFLEILEIPYNTV